MDETTVDGNVAPLQPGDPRRLGSYELIGRLGVGGQGAVFLGTAPSGDRVAVKLLHPDLTQDTDARGRFVREAMAAKQVARFCAAQVLDVQVAGDRPYIVSEYVPGPSLYRLIKEGGPLSDGALERLAIGTATALVAIHQAGIVHRDLKPANVLIGPDGPRVIDFGIAKALATTATATSRVLGTPAYMAPEQIRGELVDASVDVFAWGALMAFVATGSPPFGTDSIPMVVQRIIGDEPDLTGMPEPLRGLVRECLAKDPAARPTARQLLLRLLGQEAATGDAAVPVVAPQAGGLAGDMAGPGIAAAAAAAAGPVAGNPAGNMGRPGVAAAAGAGVPSAATAAEAVGSVGSVGAVGAEDSVAADVLAQAATIAGIRPPAVESPTATLGATAPPFTTYGAPYASFGPYESAGTLPVAPAAATTPAPVLAEPATSTDPIARRSALSRAFVIAGLAAVVVAIVALLLMATKPYDSRDNPGGTAGTSPAGQSGSAGTRGNGLPQGSEAPQYQTTKSAGGTTRQISNGTPERGATGHGASTPTPTPTHTPSTLTSSMSTPSATPSTTPPTGTPTGSGGGTPSTDGYDEHAP